MKPSDFKPLAIALWILAVLLIPVAWALLFPGNML